MDVHTLVIQATRSDNLSVLPAVAMKVIHLAQNVTTSGHKLEALIRQDVALAAKVLRVANSAMYGGRSIANIGGAITLLGFNAIRSIAATIAFQQATSRRPSALNFKMAEFWSHSLATAIAAQFIAKKVAPNLQDELYLGGMLHDVGFLVYDRFEPNYLNATIADAREKQIPIFVAEKMRCNFDHAELGGILVENWGFSTLLANLVRYHHDVDAADVEFRRPVAILAIANYLAAEAGLKNQSCHLEVDSKYFELANVTPELLAEAHSAIAQELLDVQKSFALQAA